MLAAALQFPLHSAFLAIPLEGEAKFAYQELQGRLKDFEDFLSFQNAQSPHITLHFWRELMEIEYDQVIPQSEKIAASVEPFTLSVHGADTFGSRGEDRVLFLTIPFSEELARLKKKCPWPSLQSFSPHLTLARMRHPQRFAVHKKKIMKLVSDAEFTISVDLLRFYAEINSKRQTPIHDFALSRSPSYVTK